MGDSRSDIDFTHFDPFTLSEYENLIRVIRIQALVNPALLETRGESFWLKDDIVIDEHLSATGVFTPPYEIDESRATLRIKKESFLVEKKNVRGEINTETECHFVLRRGEGDEFSQLPERLRCELITQNTYSEKAESTLLSKNKIFVEKKYRHILTTTEFTEEMDRALIPDDARKTYTLEGSCKVDATTGYVMEEK